MGGAESRAAFKEQVGALSSPNLQNEPDEFWDKLLGSALSADDINDIVRPSLVRDIIDNRPGNVQIFLKKLVDTLDCICYNGARTWEQVDKGSTALVCVRLLTRLLPILQEDPAVEVGLFWKAIPAEAFSPTFQIEAFSGKKEKDPENIRNGGVQQESEDSSINRRDGGTNDDGGASVAYTTLGNEVMCVLMKLLFLKDFCVNVDEVLAKDEELPKHRVDRRFLWCSGVGGVAASTSTPVYMIKNRVEVLRCLLVCFSGSLYKTIDDYHRQLPSWLEVFTCGNAPFTANLFCSLLSTAFSYDPVGYGIPFGAVFSNADAEQLMSATLELIIVLLDFNPLVFLDPDTGETEDVQDGQQARARNVFRSMLAGLKKEDELALIAEGFTRLLQTCLNERRTRLPKSVRAIPFYRELLISFWHMITISQDFLRHCSSRHNSNQLLTPLLFLLLDNNNSINKESSPTATSSSKVGLLHMCSFILLVLSSEREFAVRLNEPFIEKFPLDLPLFQGCYADLLCLVIHRVVIDSSVGNGNSDSLIDMLLTVLCNVSAYIKTFCCESCVKMLHLMERLSRPSWLFKAPFHYHDVLFLIDTFNNLIQYQYEGNQCLVYSILRRKNLFWDLENLTLEAAKNVRNLGDGSKATNGDEGNEELKHPHSTAGDSLGQSPRRKVNSLTTDGRMPNGTSSVAAQAGSEDPDDPESRPNDWVPTPEWFDDWKGKVPLQTVLRLIQCLLPLVEDECTKKGLTDQAEVLEFLQRTTMVGLLPVPHPIIIRSYQPNAYTALWFTSFMWGVVYSRSPVLSLYDWTHIKLIVVSSK